MESHLAGRVHCERQYILFALVGVSLLFQMITLPGIAEPNTTHARQAASAQIALKDVEKPTALSSALLVMHPWHGLNNRIWAMAVLWAVAGQLCGLFLHFLRPTGVVGAVQQPLLFFFLCAVLAFCVASACGVSVTNSMLPFQLDDKHLLLEKRPTSLSARLPAGSNACLFAPPDRQ